VPYATDTKILTGPLCLGLGHIFVPPSHVSHNIGIFDIAVKIYRFKNLGGLHCVSD